MLPIESGRRILSPSSYKNRQLNNSFGRCTVMHRSTTLRQGIAFVVVVLAPICCVDLGAMPSARKKVASDDLTVETEPGSVDGFIAPIVRFRIFGASNKIASVGLIKGNASARNLRDIKNGSISETLRKRIIDTIAWQTDEGHWELATKQPLTLGQEYSLIVPNLAWSATFTTMAHDFTPTLRRVWPPEDSEGLFLVWCGSKRPSGDVRQEPKPMRLGPGVDGVLDYGAIPGIGSDCLNWRPNDQYDPLTSALAGTVVPPVAAETADGTLVRIDPSPIGLRLTETQWEASCSHDEETVGPVCVRVFDDRVILSSPESESHPSSEWLLGVSVGGGSWTGVVGPGASWTVRSLDPSSEVPGRVSAVSVTGERRDYDVLWKTLAPMERVVINELMTNPVGPEPQQEWVELYNDGSIGVDLSGWRFEDSGGGVVLPPAVLRSGEFGLLVAESYDPTSWVDTPPAEESILIRVPAVGKNGLSNSGEPVRLLRSDGSVASVAPAIPAKQAGCSISRLRPEAPDVPASFFIDLLGGTPGSPNRSP